MIAERGLYGTPTTEVARAAGISQAYLFRLFPTKTELFVAVLERSYERVHDALLEAAREARRDGRPMSAWRWARHTRICFGTARCCSSSCRARPPRASPACGTALRAGFARLLAMVEREWEATPEEIQAFFARGMLCNVIAAMQIDEPRRALGEGARARRRREALTSLFSQISE